MKLEINVFVGERMKTTYRPSGEKILCPFIDCFYGIGLAGRGVCNGGGDWKDPNCPKYENEDEALKKWKEKELP